MIKMKILIISRRLNFQQSAPKCNANLAFALAKLGHETHVLTTLIAPDAQQRLEKANVIIHRTPRFFANKQLSPFLYAPSINKLKKRFSIDVVLGNGYTLFDDITWIHFLRFGGITRWGSTGLKIFTNAAFEKLLFSTSKLLLVPSSLGADGLKKLYRLPSSKILVQPHGVDINYYSPSKKDRSTVAQKEGKVRILFVGREHLSFEKGFHLLLKSLARVKDRANFNLSAVGFNPDMNVRFLVHRLGLDKVISFEGFMKPEKLKSIYQTSDIFVLPSLYDIFSLTTLEAMASGLPVVVSNYTGIKDILCNWRDSIIINPFNINEFSEALSILANDNELRRKIGINARHTAEKFSWENVAKKILKIFEKTLKA
jgi:glycosyltransferase involved in cell wall biosynthesis